MPLRRQGRLCKLSMLSTAAQHNALPLIVIMRSLPSPPIYSFFASTTTAAPGNAVSL